MGEKRNCPVPRRPVDHKVPSLSLKRALVLVCSSLASSRSAWFAFALHVLCCFGSFFIAAASSFFPSCLHLPPFAHPYLAERSPTCCGHRADTTTQLRGSPQCRTKRYAIRFDRHLVLTLLGFLLKREAGGVVAVRDDPSLLLLIPYFFSLLFLFLS